MIRSPIRSPIRSAISSVFDRRASGGAAAFDPINVSNASVYEPWNFSSMFQDAAQTVPVTAAGQPVRVIRDRSAVARHLIAASDAARPLLAQDGSGRYYLDFPGATPQLASAATITAAQPVLLASLASFGSGIGAGLSGLVQLGDASTNFFTIGYRPSILAARAQVRFDSQAIASVVINGATNDIVVDDVRVHHADAGSLVFRRGIDGADLYSLASTWNAQTIPNLAYRLGTIANAAFRFYGGVFVVGAGAVSAKADIIAWLDQKKTL